MAALCLKYQRSMSKAVSRLHNAESMPARDCTLPRAEINEWHVQIEGTDCAPSCQTNEWFVQQQSRFLLYFKV